MTSSVDASSRVLGVDPGTRVTGWGVVDADRSVLRGRAAGILKAPERLPLAERLVVVHEGLREVIREHAPTVVAVEDLHARHPKAALALGHARGVILLAAAQAGLEVVPYPPALVRRAVVGRGAADKLQVARLVGALLALRELPPLDATDALAVAIAHARRGPGGAVGGSSRGGKGKTPVVVVGPIRRRRGRMQGGRPG
jgi:crossover junction endodeoxyribonuclease RuvC